MTAAFTNVGATPVWPLVIIALSMVMFAGVLFSKPKGDNE